MTKRRKKQHQSISNRQKKRLKPKVRSRKLVVQRALRTKKIFGQPSGEKIKITMAKSRQHSTKTQIKASHRDQKFSGEGGGRAGIYSKERVLRDQASRQAIQFGAPRASKRGKKRQKTWGRNTKTCVKKGPEGATRAPSPPKTVPGVPVTLCQTQRSEKGTQKARVQTGAHDGAPRALGAGSTTRGYASYDDGSAPSSWCEKKTAKHNRRGKQKQQKETTKTPLPPRVQKKGLRRVPGESQKRVGPRMAPQGKHQEAGRTANKGEQTSAAGQKKEQGQTTQVRVGACPVTT